LKDIAMVHAHDIRGPVARLLGLTEVFNKSEPADPVNRQVISMITTAASELDVIIQKVVSDAASHGAGRHGK
jgi:signal transduction histidine kinase